MATAILDGDFGDLGDGRNGRVDGGLHHHRRLVASTLVVLVLVLVLDLCAVHVHVNVDVDVNVEKLHQRDRGGIRPELRVPIIHHHHERYALARLREHAEERAVLRRQRRLGDPRQRSHRERDPGRAHRPCAKELIRKAEAVLDLIGHRRPLREIGRRCAPRAELTLDHVVEPLRKPTAERDAGGATATTIAPAPRSSAVRWTWASGLANVISPASVDEGSAESDVSCEAGKGSFG